MPLLNQESNPESDPSNAEIVISFDHPKDLRKGKRSSSKYSLSNFVSCDKLSSFSAFTKHFSAIKIPTSI